LILLHCVTLILGISTAAFDLGGFTVDPSETSCVVTGPPTVTSTHPANESSGVAVNKSLSATFSEAMDPATITPFTFTVRGPGATPVPGTVTFDGPSRTATFAPSATLAPDSRYSATISTGAHDAAGNGLAADFVWNFTTGAAAPDALRPSLSLDQEGDYSYVIPAIEILGFEVALNMVDRATQNDAAYGVDWSTIRHNLTHGWEFDTDPFATNQVMHPYSGSIYFGFARASGLSFWESLAYTFVGSMVWEYAGETGPPSINDQISTTLAGGFLGEALFRMAHLLLSSGGERPGFWRELGATVIAPPTGFNRNLLCGRFNAVFPDNDPAIFARLRIGGSLNTQLSDNGPTKSVSRKEAVADFSLSYGLPGKPGYVYKRPFDYFHFEATASSSTNSTFENIMTRGLLVGTAYQEGSEYRGIWGLYGSYDYISPEVFRISSTALSLGTTGQLWLSRTVALQGSVLGGVGFGASGTIAPVGDRDYHYGTIPQALLGLRLIFDDVAMLDLTARGYYVTGMGIDDRHGHEDILRAQTSFTVRIYGPHALGIQYVASDRDAYYTGIPNRHQTMGTISLVYNFLGDPRFGAVEWRNLDSP
jgi:hypothetical protein